MTFLETVTHLLLIVFSLVALLVVLVSGLTMISRELNSHRHKIQNVLAFYIAKKHLYTRGGTDDLKRHTEHLHWRFKSEFLSRVCGQAVTLASVFFLFLTVLEVLPG